jgi:hypothetical protein
MSAVRAPGADDVCHRRVAALIENPTATDGTATALPVRLAKHVPGQPQFTRSRLVRCVRPSAWTGTPACPQDEEWEDRIRPARSVAALASDLPTTR